MDGHIDLIASNSAPLLIIILSGTVVRVIRPHLMCPIIAGSVLHHKLSVPLKVISQHVCHDHVLVDFTSALP